MVKLLHHWSSVENSQIIIIDFLDSFTYNIASQLNQMGHRCQVFSYNSLDVCKNRLKKQLDPAVVIYGPGSGHPDDYPEAIQFFKELSIKDNLFHCGICLGHQLIWKARGVATIKSSQPLHGSSIDITLPAWSSFEKSFWGQQFAVQRYNSLTLDLEQLNTSQFHIEYGECQMGRWERGITYQFHPESIGTSYPEIFFKPLSDFLYNCKNG